MQNIGRRKFLSFSLASAGTLLLERPAFAMEKIAPYGDPHFFLQIILAGGADNSYHFDARSLAMTGAGKIQNYLGQEPFPWTGSNGVTCLATSVVKPLQAFKDRFSVLNGVVMAPGFDGHEQNMNLLLTGNNFGGESFVPHLNLPETGRKTVMIDSILQGNPIATLENMEHSIAISPMSLENFRQRVNATNSVQPEKELFDFMRSRFEANAGGVGRFSSAAKLLLSGANDSVDLQRQLRKMPPLKMSDPPPKQFAKMISQFFKLSLSRSAVWTIDGFDAHAAGLAKTQPQLFKDTFQQIADVLKVLSETPYDSKRSMLDMTTFLISSEFGRTMKIPGYSVEDTGTNHNCFANTILLGGKGIRGGMVIGSSDYQTASEKLSAAHLAIDPQLIKAVGRPFDFQTLKSRTDLPSGFAMNDYLSVASVVNTVYKAFGNPASRYRSIDRGLPVAPTLDALLLQS